MSSPLQVGDIIAIANIARTLFQFGWQDRFSSSKQYNEFGQDVDALRYSLEILAEVIHNANSKLQGLSRSPSLALRWDSLSLSQIIGDCEQTIHECDELLRDNSSYAIEAGPFRNIIFNTLIKDEVVGLQTRIQQHTAKIQLVLAPFELDLLTSIQNDIRTMHQSLDYTLRRVHDDVREVLRLQGVVIPDLQQEQDRSTSPTQHLEIPTAIREKFDAAYTTTTTTNRSPSLSDLADVFVIHFYQGTVYFRPPTPSLLAWEKIPPDKAYLNLLKCIWLMEKIKDSDEFQNIAEGSHWSSYISGLDQVLSKECRRIGGELVAPSQPVLSDEFLRIWPEERRSTTVIIDKESEVILDAKIVRGTDNQGDQQSESQLQLLRYLDTDGHEFTINILGEGHIPSQADSLDFNIKTAMLIPKYVVGDSSARAQRMMVPSRSRGIWSNRMFGNGESRDIRTNVSDEASQGPFKITLGSGRRFDTYNFQRLQDAMDFQHALTGYRVQGRNSFPAHVAFVFSNQRSQIPLHKAYIQLWYPKRREADVSNKSQQSYSGSTTPLGYSSSIFPAVPSPRSTTTGFNVTGRYGTSPTFRDSFARPGIDNTRSSRLSNGLGRQQNMPTGVGPTEPIRDPFGLGGQANGNQARSSTRTTFSEDILPPRRPSIIQNSALTGGSGRPLGYPASRSRSLSSGASAPTARSRPSVTSLSTTIQSSGSSGSDQTIAVDTGGRTTGILHIPPPKPIIVILMEDEGTGERSMLTLDLPTTEVKPDLCDCRRSDARGRDCRDVCLEHALNGSRTLEARVLKPVGTEPNWDLSRLAYVRRNDEGAGNSPLENLIRVTITFRNPADKEKFSGNVHCGCPNRGRQGRETGEERRQCVTGMHRGIVGIAKEYYLKKLREYESAEAGRAPVVRGPRPND